ncbi:MAG: valine--tRNA ligase [Candidatus Thorarchaeota archaeon]
MSKKLEPAIKSKRWKPPAEEELLEQWKENWVYKFNPDSGKEIYSVDTPPPYLSGYAHLGQLIHYTQIDMIARFRRMQGNEVNFPLGIDRNGLPVELRVEREFGLDMHTTPRDIFVDKCREQLDKYEIEMNSLFQRLGIGFNTYEKEGSYQTDSPRYRAVTQATFIDLWNQGLIHSDYRPNNWCFECGTTIADAEVEYSERNTTLNYLHFEVDGMDPIKIATSRPELLCACGAVFIHPDDERYKGYGGKTAKIPLFGQEVPIIESNTAKMEFGTGALMVCSYGDMGDVQAFRDHALTPIQAVSPDGTMTESAGKYAGMKVADAKKAVTKDLKEQGLLDNQEEAVQRVPLCWRSKTPIEFLAMDEYYLKQVDFLDELMKMAKETPFFPDHNRQILIDWINRVTVDWPISRRRYYGTEIPLWYCNSCDEPVVPDNKELRYYQPWREDPPFKKCPKCGAQDGFRGEERTFDTWMDSSISALQITGYKRDEKLFKKAFGTIMRPQGKDIVRTWLYYTLLRILQLTKKPAFKEIWISGMVMDENGRPMSKSLGNSPDPGPIIDKYGVDALRFFGVLEAGLGSDIRFSEDRLAGVSKFMTKIWNVARFISMFPRPDDFDIKNLLEVDKWVLAELNQLIERIIPECDKLDFHKPAAEIRSFTWNVFADHILEMLKGRAFNSEGVFSESEQKSAWSVLHTVLEALLRVMAPITPFVTDSIYRQLYNPTGIHTELFPTPNKNWVSSLVEHTDLLLRTNSGFWKFKRENDISLRSGLPEAYVSEDLKPWSKDLKAMHGIEKINFGVPKDKGLIEVTLPESEEVIHIRTPTESKE